MTAINVTDCLNCPFYRFTFLQRTDECVHPNVPDNTGIVWSFNNNKPILPDWCPLVNGDSVIIAFKELNTEVANQ